MAKIKKTGFTLMEIVIVAGIMALFSLTLISVFLATVRGSSKAQLTQESHQEGDFALKRMASQIRAGEDISCSGDELDLTTLDGQAINFRLVSNSGTVRLAANGDEWLTGDKARISNLSFSCYGGGSSPSVVTIKFDLTVDKTGAQVQERFTQEFATSVSTRQY